MRRAMIAAALGLFGASAGWSLSFTPPEETVPAALAGDDMEIIRANCVGCHSLDYIASQPRGKDAAFWKGAVTKMMTVYGAPIEAADADRVAAVLAVKFGKP